MENQMENQPLAQTATTFTALQENWFRPFGFNLRLLTNSEAVLAAAHTSFGRFGPAPSKHPPDFIFRFFEQRVDSGQLTFPDFRMAGSLAYQTMGEDARLVVNQETGLAEGYFSPTVLANEPFFRCHFLELAFFAMLAPRGLMGVHGAALVRHGRAVLLRAQSGGGKTTLAYAAARSKFQALAEDVVWLDIKNNLWRGTPWTFHLLPDAKNLFPELASYQPILQTNGEIKLEVDLETIRPGSTTTFAKPGPVILVERMAGGRSRLEPLDLAEAKPLWLAGFAGTEMDFPDYHHHIDALLTANAYRLYFGDDIEASVNLLETLFE